MSNIQYGDSQSVLKQVIDRILQYHDPLKIILFGSYASGRLGPDSDLDLLIVMKVEGSTRRKANEIDLLMADRTIPMDFLVLTPEQYDRQKNIIGTIVRQAALEGKVIYDSAA
jgi:uncharacterized protein